MKRKSKPMRIATMLLCSAMLAGALAGCKVSGTGNESSASVIPDQTKTLSTASTSAALEGLDMNVEPTRAQYVTLAETLADLYQQNPDDTAVALSYAEKLLQLGDAAEAKEILAPMLAGETPDPQAIFLSAQIEYLMGQYTQAESLYNTLRNEYPAYKAEAESGLTYVYYQTNEYQKVQNLSGDSTTEANIGALMQAFGSREPYQISWSGEEKTTIPFVVTDPLPVVQLEANGQLMNFMIDTGAGETYLDEAAAEALGVHSVATDVGEYAGGVSVETQYGILNSLKLNGVTLESIPVNIADISGQFSADYDFEISGIIGTGVFSQFLTTMDYINGALILQPKGQHAQTETAVSELTFLKATTHFMLCKASINGKEMMLFPDSGLAADASLVLPMGTLDYAGISIPELFNAAEEGATGGLGGADFSVGYVTADTYEMGDLPTVYDMRGMYGVFPEVYYFHEEIGLFVDGIISHNYLKDYIWTIDFDTMTMTFSK